MGPKPTERPSPPRDPPPPLGEERELGPVRKVVLPSGDIGYLATRYADVLRLLSDPTFSREKVGSPGIARFSSVGPGTSKRDTPAIVLLAMDPPAHTRLRRVVSGELT